MDLRTLIVTMSLAISTPAIASELVVDGPNSEDEAKIDALVTPVISGLKSNQIRKASSDFFLTNPLMASKQSEVTLFGTQTEGAFNIYGKIIDCQIIEKINYGKFAQSRLFICQHEKFVTRWIFDLIKIERGWVAGNLRFDDNYKQGLEQ